MITYLFKKFYGYTYYAIIGFSITSLLMFIPKFSSVGQGLIGVLIGVIAFVFMFGITRLDKKIEEDKRLEKS